MGNVTAIDGLLIVRKHFQTVLAAKCEECVGKWTAQSVEVPVLERGSLAVEGGRDELEYSAAEDGENWPTEINHNNLSNDEFWKSVHIWYNFWPLKVWNSLLKSM